MSNGFWAGLFISAVIFYTLWLTFMDGKYVMYVDLEKKHKVGEYYLDENAEKKFRFYKVEAR